MLNPLSLKRFQVASLHVGLSPTGIALLTRTGRWNKHYHIAADVNINLSDLWDFGALPDRLKGLLKDSSSLGLQTTIIIDDTWARQFMVTPPHNATSLEDCRASVAMRFQELYGDSPSQWKIAADWQARSPFLACAFPLALLDAINQVAMECGLTLLTVTSGFIAAWNKSRHALDDNAWFGVFHGTQFTLAVIHQHRLCALRTTIAPADTAEISQWLATYMEREALRLQVSLPSNVQLYGPLPIGSPPSIALPNGFTQLAAKNLLQSSIRLSQHMQFAISGVRR